MRHQLKPRQCEKRDGRDEREIRQHPTIGEGLSLACYQTETSNRRRARANAPTSIRWVRRESWNSDGRSDSATLHVQASARLAGGENSKDPAHGLGRERHITAWEPALAAIVVEPAAGLPAEPACLDIFHQKRARAVFGVGEPVVQHLHDRKAGVEADEVGKRSGPIGWCAPSFIAASIASTVPTPS